MVENALMINRYKYPRTPHLPYSLSKTDDDKTLLTDNQFVGEEVVVTIKMDGENTTVYPDGFIHARSLDGYGYPWQSYLKQHVWDFCQQMPDDSRIIGENLYARHSIGYTFDSLWNTFQVFCVADSHYIASWDYIEDLCNRLNLPTVPVIYLGPYIKDRILSIFEDVTRLCGSRGQDVEGFVVRTRDAFKIVDFSSHVAKFVRANHVQTDSHWRDHWKPNYIEN